MDESEDDPPKLQSVMESSDSETEDNIDSDEDGANTECGTCNCSDHDFNFCDDINDTTFHEELEQGTEPARLPQFHGLFDRLKEVMESYTGEVMTHEESQAQDATLADAILHHFNKPVLSEASRDHRTENLWKIDEIVDQVLTKVT